MARSREFDTDIALAKAMDVFWELGYSEATLPDLLAGMNLTRGSFYKAFKGKKALFLRILNDYDEQAVSDAVSHLTAPEHDGWDRIFMLFDYIADAVDAGDRRGCLLCSAVAGPAVYDADIAAFATKSLNRMHVAFQRALQDTTPPDDVDPLAHLLVTQYIGLRIMARTNVPASTLKQNAQALRRIATRVSNDGPA